MFRHRFSSSSSSFEGALASLVLTGKRTQVFVNNFVGFPSNVTTLVGDEFEFIGLAVDTYADGLGELVLPAFEDILWIGATGISFGKANYEVHRDQNFSSIVASGILNSTSRIVVNVGLSGPFFVRYRLSTTSAVPYEWFEDPGGPFMVPEPIIGAGAVAPAYTATESSAFNGLGVGLIFDDIGTVASHTSLVNPPHWYRVDFQDLYVVTSYKLWGFNNAVTPSLPVNYELQGSNDGGTTWVSVDTQVNNPPPNTAGYNWVSGGETIPHLTLSVADPGSFSSYRFYCTVTSNDQRILRIRELQLIGHRPLQALVGAGAGAPAAIFGNFAWSGDFTAAKLFENTLIGAYHTNAYTTAFPVFWTADLGVARELVGFKLWPRSSNYVPPTSFIFRGSNDTTNGNDGTWTTLLDVQNFESVIGQPGSAGVVDPALVVPEFFKLTATGSFRYYGMVMFDSRNNKYITIGEIQLIGYEVPPEIVALSTPASEDGQGSMVIPPVSAFTCDVTGSPTVTIEYEIFDNPWFYGSASHSGNVAASPTIVAISDDTWFVRYRAFIGSGVPSKYFNDPGNYKVYGGGFTDEPFNAQPVGLNPGGGTVTGTQALLVDGTIGPGEDTGLSVLGATGTIFMAFKFFAARSLLWFFIIPRTTTTNNNHPVNWSSMSVGNVTGATFDLIDAPNGPVDGSQPYNKYKLGNPIPRESFVWGFSGASNLAIGEMVFLWKD